MLGVVSAENCGIRSCSADIVVDVPARAGRRLGLLLEMPQTQFIARVGGHSNAHRDGGLVRGFGGDAGVGIFRAPPGCPGVERQFVEPLMM